MKKYKFLLIALAAAGLTIVSQARSFSRSRKPTVIACYTNATIPSPGTPIHMTTTGCATAQAQVGFTATAFSGVVSNPGLTCTGMGVFCCANIESSTGFISSVYCYRPH